MQSTLQKWLILPLLFALLVTPAGASAQAGVTLDRVTIQLWPEFDQPDMLVIYDFTLPEGTPLPVNISLRIPAEANLIAVAYAPSGNLLNVPYQEPVQENEWQVVTIPVDTDAVYHIEYYAPLERSDDRREYLYVWPGDYTVNNFNVSFKIPIDTTEFSTEPQMQEVVSADNGQTFLELETSSLPEGEQFPIQLAYVKTTDRLSVADQPLDTGIVDENTQGRISLGFYLPYILGGLGILLILTGGLYFWQYSKGRSRPRLRHRAREAEPVGGEVYCHQCGKRAQPADRFCRTCGTRLRKES